MLKTKKRVFVCGLYQESNAFNPVLAKIEDFARLGICEGEEILRKNEKCVVELFGAIDALRESDVEIIGGVAMSATSGGPIEHTVVERFIQKTVDGLKNAGHLDGVVVSLHGATMSDLSDDVCGDILESTRKAVGDKCVISVPFDLHANITEKIMQNADYICGYQSYPHLDLYQTGYRSAKMLLERLNGKMLRTAYVALPMIAPAHGYTTASGALLKLTNRAQALVKSGKIVDYTIFQAQPWLDVKEFASTVIVIAEDECVAKEVAEDLAREEFSIRKELLGMSLMSVEEVIERARENKTGKPIVLVDSADSPNAGACGDSAFTLEKLLPYKDELRCALSVTDEKAVEQAFAVGVGNSADFQLGATIAPKLTKSVLLKDAKVRSLHDGNYFLHGPQERGFKDYVGKTAVLQVGEILIHVSCFGRKGDLAFYRSFGIEPAFCDLICVKACTSFRAGYEPIVSEICNANTLGAAGPVLAQLPYEKRPRPMYPFEEITDDLITKAKCYR